MKIYLNCYIKQIIFAFALSFSVNRSFAGSHCAIVFRSALYELLIERATYKELNEKRSTENIIEDSKSLLLRARAREYELFRLCSQRERKKKNGQQLFASYG